MNRIDLNTLYVPTGFTHFFALEWYFDLGISDKFCCSLLALKATEVSAPAHAGHTRERCNIQLKVTSNELRVQAWYNTSHYRQQAMSQNVSCCGSSSLAFRGLLSARVATCSHSQNLL
eukprot:1338410-Amphidinium_carterae.1